MAILPESVRNAISKMIQDEMELPEQWQEGLRLARLGIAIFPVKNKFAFLERGVYNNSSDEGQIFKWASQFRNYNYAIPCGEVNDIVVLDVDQKNGGMEAIEKYEIPDCPTVLTAGGGRHFFFRRPVLPPGKKFKRNLGNNKGIEIQDNGRYVVGSGSFLIDEKYYPEGGRHVWEASSEFGDVHLPEWPFPLGICTDDIVEKPDVDDDEVLAAIIDKGLYRKHAGTAGKHLIHCPWQSEHTSDGGQGETAYWQPYYGGYAAGGFHCFHDHCSNRKIKDLKDYLGIQDADLTKLMENYMREESDDASDSESKEEYKFPFKSVYDICNTPHEYKWLVKDMIEEDTMVQIFGPPESGKSLIAIDIGLSIASGIPWFGRDTSAGPVIYICGEGFNGLGRRFKAWELVRGEDFHENTPFHASEIAANMTDDASVSQVAKSVMAIKKKHGANPKLIIIDTVARNFGGEDENSTQAMSKFIRHVDLLRSGFGATVMVVHHSGKMFKDQARGSSALRGAMDVEYMAEQEDGAVTFVSTKTKDIMAPKPMEFKVESIKIPHPDMEVTGPWLRITSEKPSLTADLAMEVLAHMQINRMSNGDGEWVYVDEWYRECLNMYEGTEVNLRKIKSRKLKSQEVSQDEKLIKINALCEDQENGL